MPIGGALSSARVAKAGLGGYALAIAIALALGVSCAWAMQTAGGAVLTHLGRTDREHSGLQRGWRFGAVYFAAILWIAFALILGAWVSSMALRLVF